MGFDVTSWLLFLAVLVNQVGRVMIPAIKTSVLADKDFAPEFEQSVGAMLSGVSLVCLFGKLLGAVVTDKLGGWLVLIVVFVIWVIVTLMSIATTSVPVFGAAWLLNSFAYTITWGAAVQVVGATYDDANRGAQLSKIASASRFGATLGNIFFGQLLSSGLHWRQTLMPAVPIQVLLLLMCAYYWATSRTTDSLATAKPASAAAAKKEDASKSAGGDEPSALAAMLSLDFWLMLLPKAVLFTYTQFFMNYIPQLLNVVYGYDHGAAATYGGVAQGGSVVGLLYVGNVLYKKSTKAAQVKPEVCK
jgi:MFS family permease